MEELKESFPAVKNVNPQPNYRSLGAGFNYKTVKLRRHLGERLENPREQFLKKINSAKNLDYRKVNEFNKSFVPENQISNPKLSSMLSKREIFNKEN